MEDKILKLTNSVYKVLEFFPESDPLKNRAKDKALVIMDNLVLISGTNRAHDWATLADTFDNKKIKVQILEDIEILLGYLWIGKTQKWLNSINYLIIVNEYEKIKKELELFIKPEAELTQKLPGLEKNIIPEPEFVEPDIEEKEAPHEVSERQHKIIEFLTKNGKSQVMAMQEVLPDITKRTIRRDLDELLEAGVIIREGEFNQVFYKIND